MDKVKLLGGIFRASQDKGKEYLLYLDEDKLLAPCYEAAGKEPKKPRYGGWESMQISGHSLGHFISALASMYVAENDEKLKDKLDYIVSELAYLQTLDEEGYVSGFPRTCFDKVFSGEFNVTRFELGDSWVPWYSIHKIFAGLVDAYELVANEQALEVVIKLSNWAKRGTDKLNDEQFEKMLYCEHGGMCETMAKLYKITNNKDYLDLAIRFAHKETLSSLVNFKDELEGKHANTQIPKVIGAATLYEILGKKEYRDASEFFWNIVTKSRSYAIGGNSRDEHFGKVGTEKLGVTTAETCNTYNMLKLTEHIYDWEHNSEYMDYYENALYNHILASQDPESGMKTYFVSTQPGHFKVYCSSDDSFWCCTGTGMENPGRYTRNIYYRDNNDLFINLYIGSSIELQDKNVVIRQETNFPESNTSKIIFEEANNEEININIRVPYWVSDKVKAIVNGEEIYCRANIGYLSINKKWNRGDIIDINIPMDIHIYVSKEDSHKVAFMYGPIVLAGALGKDNFPESDILEDHLKLNHYPGIVVPKLVMNSDDNILNFIKPVEGKNLTFKIDSIGKPGNVGFTLIPFYSLHHQRYTIYFTKVTQEEYDSTDLNSLGYQEMIDNVTLDLVNPNEQQSEIEHKLQSNNSNSNYFSDAGKGFREIRGEGFFSYKMKIDMENENYLFVTYWGSDREELIDGRTMRREFNIYADDILIAEEVINEDKPYSLFDKCYIIPEEIIKGKSKVRIKFESKEDDKVAGRVFGLRIISKKL